MTAQLSREQLKARCKSEIEQLEITLKNGSSDTPNLVEEELEIYRLALAAMDSEPVAWVRFRSDGGIDGPLMDSEIEEVRKSSGVWTPLYRAAPPTPVAVPDECPRSIIDDAEEFDSAEEMARTIWTACRAAMQAEPVTSVTVPEEKGSSLQLRNLIRQRHAEWSEKTFGNVGPVGPLKHLAKEAIEAADAPDDLSEWADMQFLLWDAQRRAGICDGEITAAMEEKLKVNMSRQWPEPKDGEPRLHIKHEQEV